MASDEKDPKERPIHKILWPPVCQMPPDMQEKDRVNLADYLKADAKAFHQSDDWGFVFDEKQYSSSERSTQEKLVSHIQASCQEQGFTMTVHTWANKETRGTLRIRLKCSNNRRTKCKFSFQLCFGLAEGFWYLRRGSGNHVHNGHELDPPKIGIRKTTESLTGQKRDPSMGSLTTSSSASREPRLNQYGAAIPGVTGGSGSFSSGTGSFSYASGYQQSQQFPQQGMLPQHVALQQASIHSFPAGSSADLMRQASFGNAGYPYGSMGSSIHGSYMAPPGANSFSMSSTFSSAPRPGFLLGHSIDEMNAASSMLGLPGARDPVSRIPPPPPPPPPPRPAQESRQVSSEAEERRKRFLAASGALPSAEDRRKKFLAASNEHSQMPSNTNGDNSQNYKGNANERGSLEETSKATPPATGKASSVDFMYSSSDLTHAIGDEMKEGKIDIMASTTNIFGENPNPAEKSSSKGAQTTTPKANSMEISGPPSKKAKLDSQHYHTKTDFDGKPGKLSDFTERKPQIPSAKDKRSIFMNSRDLVEDMLEKESKTSGDSFSVPRPRPPVGRDSSALDFLSKAELGASHGRSLANAVEREPSALDFLSKSKSLANGPLIDDPELLKQGFLQQARELLMASEEVQALLGTPLEPSAAPLWEKVTKSASPESNTQIELSITISGSNGAGVAYVVARNDVGLETLRVTTASGSDSVNVIPKAPVSADASTGNTARAKFLASSANRPLGGLADHTSSIPNNRILTKATTTTKARQSGTLDDFTSAPSRVTKETKGANMYSSIGSFAFSSAGSLNESVDDLDKLEGFGGGSPDEKAVEKDKTDGSKMVDVPTEATITDMKSEKDGDNKDTGVQVEDSESSPVDDKAPEQESNGEN